MADREFVACSGRVNSLKSPTTLTLTATVSARAELTYLDTGESLVRVYPLTTLTRTWTRESSNTRYEIQNGNPAVDKFRLVTDCCCWKCRWTTIVRSLGVRESEVIRSLNFNAPYTDTDIAFTGDPPVVTNGTWPITCSIFWRSHLGGSPKYCMKETEEGRSQQLAGFNINNLSLGVANDSRVNLDFSYTDGEGGSITGVTSQVSLPIAETPQYTPIDACADLPSGFVQINSVGDESDAGKIDTTTASLKLEFAFT